MTRRGMLIIMTIGAFGLVLMLIMLQQALEETQQLGPLLKLRQEIEQTYDLEDVTVTRRRVSSGKNTSGGQSDKRFWIVVRTSSPSTDRDDESVARAMVDEVERMYEGDRQKVYGFSVELQSSGERPSVKLVVRKTRGPAPTTVTRPRSNQ